MTSSSISNATATFCEFASSLTFDGLDRSVIGCVKRIMLDAVGCALAATSLGPGCGKVSRYAVEQGREGSSRVFGYGHKLSSRDAAFVNGALVHALNFDPIAYKGAHLGIVCVAAQLAMAEEKGHISGRDLIIASVLACELTARLSAAVETSGADKGSPYLPGQFLSYFGAAAGAAKVIGLDARRMRDALGLALMQAGGSRQIVLHGDPPAKAIYGAFPNHAAVIAVQLSQHGIGADIDVLGPPAGLFAMIGTGFCADTFLRGLGDRFHLMNVVHKLMPASGYVIPFIEAAGMLSTACSPDEITRIEIVLPAGYRAWVEPADERRRPSNAASASNSIPFCVASVLSRQSFSLLDLTDAGLADPAIACLAERCEHRLDDAASATVSITAKDGRLWQAAAPLQAEPANVSDAQLAAKFRSCCSHAQPLIAEERVQGIVDMLLRLDEIEDVSLINDAVIDAQTRAD